MALPQLTQNQLDKLLTKPNWLNEKTPIAGRVFASNEGWMLSPTKIHPEGKQMPAECVAAIPNLSALIEGTVSTVGADASATPGYSQEVNVAKFLFKTISVTRRSRSRYIVNIAMDESLTVTSGTFEVIYPTSTLTNSIVANGTRNPTSIFSGAPNFTVTAGESFGRIQIDLSFTDPIDTLEIDPLPVSGYAWSPEVLQFSGTFSLADKEGNPLSGFTDADLISAVNNITLSDRWDGSKIIVVP